MHWTNCMESPDKLAFVRIDTQRRRGQSSLLIDSKNRECEMLVVPKKRKNKDWKCNAQQLRGFTDINNKQSPKYTHTKPNLRLHEVF